MKTHNFGRDNGCEDRNAETTKTMLLFEVSHTIRGSLTSIMAICSMLDKDSLTPENRILVEHLDKAAHQLDADLARMSRNINAW